MKLLVTLFLKGTFLHKRHSSNGASKQQLCGSGRRFTDSRATQFGETRSLRNPTRILSGAWRSDLPDFAAIFGLELLHRRLLFITLTAWLPLLLLATLGSRNGSVDRLSFFHDVEVHVRFLVALPVLIGAEVLCTFADASGDAPLRRAAHRFTAGPASLRRGDRVSHQAP